MPLLQFHHRCIVQLSSNAKQLKALFAVVEAHSADCVSLTEDRQMFASALSEYKTVVEQSVMESDVVRELLESTMEEKAQLEADKVAAAETVLLASAEIQALCPMLNFFVTVLLDALLLKFTECR